VVVIIVTPVYLDSPNVLSVPSAMVVGIGAAAALAGGRWAIRIGLLISVLGLMLSAVWLWLAKDGFGKGVPWVDDMMEAGILSGLFLAAIVLLLIAHRGISRVAGSSL
jgi:Na+/H+ antiporter NhaC